MKIRSRLAATLLLLSVSSPAMAASATPEGAAKLTGVFQTYLGKEPGVVTVSPAGEAYDVTLDVAPFIAKAKSGNFTASVTPFAMKVTEQGGGKWLVTQDQAISVKISAPGSMEMDMKIGSLRSSSIFDEAMAAFSTSTGDYVDVAVNQTTTMPDASVQRMSYAMKNIHVEANMTGEGAGIGGSVRMDIQGLAQTINTPSTPGGPPMDLSVAVAKMTQDSTVKGFKIKPMLDLVAWFVAHPTPEAIKASSAEIKPLLRSMLPLFDNMSATGTMDALSIGTPMGPVSAAKTSYGLNMSGLVKDGLFGESIAISGLTLPPALVPEWAAKLAPSEFSFGFKVSGFDAASATNLFMDNLDFTADPPLKPGMDAEIMKAFLPTGAVTITLDPGKLVSQILNLGYEGSMTAGPAALPAGQATITAKGLDEVMAAFQAAPPEMGLQQGVMMLIAAKGMAKTDADGNSVWKIESTPAGTVTINGLDPLKMQ